MLRPIIHQMCRSMFRDSDIIEGNMGVDITAPPTFMRIMQFALNGFNMQLEIPAAARFNRSKLIEVLQEDATVGPVFNELMDFMRNNVSYRPQYAFFQRIVRIPVSNSMISGADKPFSRILPLVTYLFETKGIVDRLIGAMGCDLNDWFARALEGESEREMQSLRDIVSRGLELSGGATPAIPAIEVPATLVASVAPSTPVTVRGPAVVAEVDTRTILPAPGTGPAVEDVRVEPAAPTDGTRAASPAEQARLAQILAEMGM